MYYKYTLFSARGSCIGIGLFYGIFVYKPTMNYKPTRCVKKGVT